MRASVPGGDTNNHSISVNRNFKINRCFFSQPFLREGKIPKCTQTTFESPRPSARGKERSGSLLIKPDQPLNKIDKHAGRWNIDPWATKGHKSCIFLSLFRHFVPSFISLNGNASSGLPGDSFTFA